MYQAMSGSNMPRCYSYLYYDYVQYICKLFMQTPYSSRNKFKNRLDLQLGSKLKRILLRHDCEFQVQL